MDPFLGQLMLVPYDFAPRGWAFCAGQILPISQNTALFSLLGTIYGGDGQTTFALPDLRGRFAMSSGQGPGLTNRSIGEVGGQESVTLTQNDMPLHTHQLMGSNADATTSDPTYAALAKENVTVERNASALPVNGYSFGAANAPMSATSIGAAGGNSPHSNMQPYLALNYVIALTGVFPSRN